MPRQGDMGIELGDLIKDEITGCEGVVVGITDWLYGCKRFTIQPTKVNREGKPNDPMAFDAPQCVLLKKAVAPNIPSVDVFKRPNGGPGGPHQTPARRPDPKH